MRKRKLNLAAHAQRAIERDEELNEAEIDIDAIEDAPYPMEEIVSDMAIRLYYQLHAMEMSVKMACVTVEHGRSTLSAEYCRQAFAWSADHGLGFEQGFMAVMHFRSKFGGGWDALRLRMVLDDALAEAEKIQIAKV